MEEVSPPDNKTKGYKYGKIPGTDYTYLDSNSTFWYFRDGSWSLANLDCSGMEAFVLAPRNGLSTCERASDVLEYMNCEKLLLSHKQARNKFWKLNHQADALEFAAHALYNEYDQGSTDNKDYVVIQKQLEKMARDLHREALELSESRLPSPFLG